MDRTLSNILLVCANACRERVLKATGSRTLRGDPKYNSVVIGLYVNAGDERKLASAGFDGFYTYFAADRFTYGSTISNWKTIGNLVPAFLPHCMPLICTCSCPSFSSDSLPVPLPSVQGNTFLPTLSC